MVFFLPVVSNVLYLFIFLLFIFFTGTVSDSEMQKQKDVKKNITEQDQQTFKATVSRQPDRALFTCLGGVSDL